MGVMFTNLANELGHHLVCPFISQHTSLDGAALRGFALGTQPPALLWPTSGDPSRDIRAEGQKNKHMPRLIG